MAYRDDDDKEKEGGNLMEGAVDEVLGEKDDDEDELVGGLDANVDDEKAWE